eukprot:gene31512-9124_t
MSVYAGAHFPAVGAGPGIQNSKPGCFVPMVLPTPELVEELHRVLAKHNCSGITSIGSGGRLDFERQLARHPSNPRIKAIDML